MVLVFKQNFFYCSKMQIKIKFYVRMIIFLSFSLMSPSIDSIFINSILRIQHNARLYSLPKLVLSGLSLSPLSIPFPKVVFATLKKNKSIHQTPLFLSMPPSPFPSLSSYPWKHLSPSPTTTSHFPLLTTTPSLPQQF